MAGDPSGRPYKDFLGVLVLLVLLGDNVFTLLTCIYFCASVSLCLCGISKLKQLPKLRDRFGFTRGRKFSIISGTGRGAVR